MFFLLSKLLSFLIMPLTWIFLLLFFSFRGKDDRRKKRYRIAAVVLILLFTNRFIFDRVMHVWEINTIQTPPKGSYDAIIILGGISTYDPDFDRVQFSNGNDRLMQGLLLLKEGVAPKILFTGGSGSVLHSDKKEGVWIRKFLRTYGIPDSCMIFENESRNTHENALFSKPLLAKYAPGGRYLIVTSGFHMRRALGCFSKAGIRAIPFSADRYSGPLKFEFDYAFIPDAETLSCWNTLFHEWFGCVAYKLSGYM
ncbi:MAG TPA: YdcF family protein [Bacteroidia bacterium]|nr:YdcF family protein [Bacteroidia bacterium]